MGCSSGRERDTFGCAGCCTSPRTLSRSATIISIHVGRTPNKKELALHIHYFLALHAKSYNDTA
ncbi:hypothetical protein CAT75_08530 [Acinetobacter baumannii]|nr:hypothetical protein CAT75_08530 [Acinetobacter baumannii]